MKRFLSMCCLLSALGGVLPSYAQVCSKHRLAVNCTTGDGCGEGSCMDSYIYAMHIDGSTCSYDGTPGCPTGCFHFKQYVDVCCDNGSFNQFIVQVCCNVT
jgi:hypothetical protein